MTTQVVSQHHFRTAEPFVTEQGTAFPHLDIAFHIGGQWQRKGGYDSQNQRDSKLVWVCPPLTASSNPSEWWKTLFESGRLFDPAEHTFVCVSPLGSAYGSTGPLSKNDDGEPFYDQFPPITLRDMAQVQEIVRRHLNLDSIDIVIGPSVGGAVAIEWALLNPTPIRNLIVIACNAKQSAYGHAWNETQRMAFELDPTNRAKTDVAGNRGLQLARAMAVLSYRGHAAYARSEAKNVARNLSWDPGAYQHFKGEELAQRFNAYSYRVLLDAMDTHDIGRGRGGVDVALESIDIATLVVGLSSDERYPVHEQWELAQALPRGHFELITTDYGHDGFLTEPESLAEAISAFLSRSKPWSKCNSNH